MNVMDEIRRRLAVLEPTRFELIDDSALHAGHRLIYDALGEMMRREIHALAIQAKLPEEQ